MIAQQRNFLLFCLLSMLLGGCADADAGAAGAVPVQYFRLASSQSENYVTNQACQKFCDLVEDRSDGTIIIQPILTVRLAKRMQCWNLSLIHI